MKTLSVLFTVSCTTMEPECGKQTYYFENVNTKSFYTAKLFVTSDYVSLPSTYVYLAKMKPNYSIKLFNVSMVINENRVRYFAMSRLCMCMWSLHFLSFSFSK